MVVSKWRQACWKLVLVIPGLLHPVAKGYPLFIKQITWGFNDEDNIQGGKAEKTPFKSMMWYFMQLLERFP